MKKKHTNLFTPSLFTLSIYEIIYAALFKDYHLKIIILIEMTNITYVVFGHWSGTFFKVQVPQTSRLFIKIKLS